MAENVTGKKMSEYANIDADTKRTAIRRSQTRAIYGVGNS